MVDKWNVRNFVRIKLTQSNLNMKRKLLVLLLSTICLVTMADEPKSRLVVWAKDGTRTYFDLTETPKTTFKETELVITSESLTVSYPLDQVLRYTYELASTGIENVINETPVRISQYDDAVYLKNLKAGTVVCLYTADGMLVSTQKADGSNAITISLTNRPAGIYIVKANDVIYKMRKL